MLGAGGQEWLRGRVCSEACSCCTPRLGGPKAAAQGTCSRLGPTGLEARRPNRCKRVAAAVAEAEAEAGEPEQEQHE